ncbi:DUF1542 domain-containing protein, partial [Streptococcus pyogenes]|uniref:DUF1542 domain-containing protein n=1 Tax=Streptococcus pyogenes TaxID=1314 RepID=UPI001881C43E
MFLKHQDVKQKNWRMRKVKKLFVSSCMLLTVGLGVAVPTAFSQSNGVMVVKAKEVPAADLEEKEKIANSPELDKSKNFYPINSFDGWQPETSTEGNLGKFIPNKNGGQDIATKGNVKVNIAATPLGEGKFKLESGARVSKPGSFYNGGIRTQTQVLEKDNLYSFKFKSEQTGEAVEFKTRIRPVESSGSLGKEKRIRLNGRFVSTQDGWSSLKNDNHSVDFVGEGKPLSIAFRLSPRSDNKKGGYIFSNLEITNISLASIPKISEKVYESATTLSGIAETVDKVLDPRKSFKGDIVKLYKGKVEIGQTTVLENNTWTIPKLTGILKQGEKLELEIKNPKSGLLSKRVPIDVVAKPYDKDQHLQDSKASLDEAYRQTVENITQDNWLKSSEKQKQTNAAKLAYDQGIIELGRSNDKVAINSVVTKYTQEKTGLITKEHILGEKDKVITAAKNAIEEKATAEKTKIDSDNSLTTPEKEAQLAQLSAAKEAALTAITESPDADTVGTKQTEGEASVSGIHQGKDLEAIKTAAKNAIEEKATAEKTKINNDITLTTEDKAKQLKEVDEALAKAKDNVKAAKTADAINGTRDKGVATIDAVHKAGQDLGARKSGQVSKLEEAAKATKDKISADPTLTSKEKEEQSKAVDAELKKATETVNAADTADKVDEALGKGVTDIKNQHKMGNPVDARREAHGKDLDRIAQATKDAIEKDPTLTTEEKAKQVKGVDAAKERSMAKLNEAKNADELDKAYGDGVTDIKSQHKTGNPVDARRGLHNKSIDEVAQATKDAITADTTLTEAEKETQRGNVDKEATKAKEELAKATDADALNKAYGDGVTNIKNQHKTGDPIDARRGLHNKSIDEVAQATKDAITADTTLTEAEKETQRGNVDKEATKAKEELAKAKDADALDKAYGDGVTSIKNQHKSGKGLDVRKDEHKKALEAVAKRVTAEIEADPTLTPEVREQQKAEVQKELELATDKIAEAKDADEADKAYGDGVTAIENAHVIGKGIEARKDLAKKDLAEAVAKTKALIIEDKTLTDDQRKEQLSGVDTEYAKGIENIDAAKDAAGVDKAYSDGVRDILAQYKEGQNLDDRRNAAKEFLLKEADKVTKLINDDPTLTHDQKVNQINKVEQAKLDAIKSVDDAQTADAINDALGKGIENINNQYQHGDGVDVRKATAKGDLEKEAAKVKALIAKDPTLTQADKDKQTAAVDAAKNTAIAAVDKATTADGVNQELGKGITAINKAYRPGEAVKARKGAAKADLEKEAAKVKALIAKDPTLTQADKDKQTAAVDAAKNTAIAAVDDAQTAEGINQELGKGITAINKAYRPGEGVKARKEAA